MNRGIVKIDWFKLSQLLELPDGFRAVTAHVDPVYPYLAITVEGPGIPEVGQGERYPTVQMVDHFMTDKNGVKWTRREIQAISTNPLGVIQTFTESKRTL